MRLLLLLFLLLFSTTVCADHSVQMGATAMQFNFKEYDEQGAELLREQGMLTGARLSANGSIRNWYLGLDYQRIEGSAEYLGQTQSGQLHATTTDEQMQDVKFTLGWRFRGWRQQDEALLFGGIGYHEWVRDIQTRDGVLGLFEDYRWGYLQLGARGYLKRTFRFRWQAQLELMRTFFPQLKVNFKGRYADTVLPLGKHYGMRFSLPMAYHLDEQWLLTFEPYVEIWELGRSEHLVLTDNDGFVAGGLHEPRGASQFYGANLVLGWLF